MVDYWARVARNRTTQGLGSTRIRNVKPTPTKRLAVALACGAPSVRMVLSQYQPPLVSRSLASPQRMSASCLPRWLLRCPSLRAPSPRLPRVEASYEFLLSDQCRFRDVFRKSEPGCAVLAAGTGGHSCRLVVRCSIATLNDDSAKTATQRHMLHAPEWPFVAPTSSLATRSRAKPLRRTDRRLVRR